jgi:hypothetical protein
MPKPPLFAGFFLSVLTALALVAYAWLPGSLRKECLTAYATEPYQKLAEGLLAGHLYLSQRPDPKLVELPDPYDPAANAPYREDNLSYYRGHYYLYQGITPALLLFAPIRLLTGRYPTQWAAAVVFVAIGSTAGIWLLWFLRSRCFTACPLFLLVMAATGFAFANGYQTVLGAGVIANHVAIASGYCFSMLALAAFTRATVAPRQGLGFALGSFALGLAVASRPNLLVGAGGVSFFFLWGSISRQFGGSVKALIGTLAAGLVPLGAILFALIAFNILRFGRPFEFGQHLMLGAWNQSHLATFSLASVRENLRHYLWRPNRLDLHFPFLNAPDELATGIAENAPWVWLAPAAIWGCWNSVRFPAARIVGLAALSLAIGSLLTLIFLPSGDASGALGSANARYIFDFQPACMLFISLGVIICGDCLRGVSWLIRALELGATVTAFLSVLAALSLEFQNLPAGSYAPLATVLGQPAFLYEQWRGKSYGPVAFDVSFPRNRTGHTEPLVETGPPGRSDLLYVDYLNSHQVRFGLISGGTRGPTSDPLSINYRITHHLEIWMGSLMPSLEDPALNHLNRAAARTIRRRIRLVLDGRIVLDDQALFHPASADEVWFGSCRETRGFCDARFQGILSNPQRLPITIADSEVPSLAYRHLQLTLRLPSPRPHGAEPLVSTGAPGAGDIIYLKYEDQSQVQIGFDHWGHPSTLSPPLTLNSSDPHTVEIDLTSFQAGSPPQPGLRVVVDGKAVLSSPDRPYPSAPDEVSIGRNPIGASTCTYTFTGQILAVHRLNEPTTRTQTR